MADAKERMRKLRERRRRISVKQYEIWLDWSGREHLERLRRPGEGVSAVVMRALEALDADVIGGKRMMMKSTGLTLDARQLLEGFINSFNNLLLPADKYVDRAQETYAILDYFRKLGSALGYWPWCEVSKRDLEWYGPKDDEDEEYKKVILHLESENCSKRLGITIDKLVAKPGDPDKSPQIRIALVWADADRNYKMSDIDRKRMATCSDRQQCELLLIVRCEHELSKPINLGPAGKAWMHPVKSWLAVGGDCEPLPEYEWYILWPQPWGLQTAWWPYNPPMGKAYGS